MTIIRTFVLACITIAVVASSAFADAQSIPAGWFAGGSAPQLYTAGVDKSVRDDNLPSALLTSTQAQGTSFGTLMQMFTAQDYAGMRIALSAYIKSDNVTARAALWMRVDGEGGKVLLLDNMRDRPITGTTDWKE